MSARCRVALAPLSAVAALLLTPAVVRGNDGFFQGAGSDLRLVKSKAVRVVRERLVISPTDPPVCAEVLLKGKPIPHERDPNSIIPTILEPLAPGDVVLGAPGPCGPPPPMITRLHAPWHADARYDVEALEDVSEALVGFPVPEWDFQYDSAEALEGVALPGVTNFATSVDGERVRRTETRGLEARRSRPGRPSPSRRRGRAPRPSGRRSTSTGSW